MVGRSGGSLYASDVEKGSSRMETEEVQQLAVIIAQHIAICAYHNGNQCCDSATLCSLVPRHSVIGEKSAWYPLFAHVRLSRFLWGTWKLLLY